MKTTPTFLDAAALVLGVVVAVYGEDKPAAPAPGSAASAMAASPAPAAGTSLANEWLRKQSDLFDVWDVGGQFRARVEHAEYLDAPGAAGIDTKHGPVDFRAVGGDNANTHLLLREFVHVGYTPLSWLQFMVEGRDSSSQGDDRIPSPDSDSMDLHQAYIKLGNPELFPVTAKVGRQELAYGDERLIGASDWTNVRRTFDAVKLRYENEAFWVDAFASRPVIVWDDHFNQSNDYDFLSGVYASSTKLIPVQESQLYFLARNAELNSPAFYGPSPDPQGATARDIYTVGGRVKSLPGKIGGWDYTAEGAYQFGRFRETTKKAPASVLNHNLDQDAFAASATLGYTWTEAFGTPRAGLEYVYSSGDSDPADGKHGTFDNLFPTNHKFYGIMDLFSWQNQQDLHFMASLKPVKKLTVTADYRLFWLADTRDSFYTNKGARRGGLAATDGGGYGINPNYSSYLGSELDLVATYSITPYALVQGGLGHFFVGDYIKSSLAAVGGAKDATFIYGQFTVNF